MTQSTYHTEGSPARHAGKARKIRLWRNVFALMLREMSSTYGRSAMGYLWALLEPIAGIMLLTFVFSLALRAPPLGTSFPLFYACGLLPFLAYLDISQKMAQAVRFSRQLLFYPGVSFIDALLARLLLNGMTQLMVAGLVFAAIILAYGLDVIIDPPALALAAAMTLALGAGIGTLNCFLLSSFPSWERIWAILNRPVLIVSGVFFLFDSIPPPYRGYLWWNPLVHIIGQTRKGIYATYDAAYVSPGYVFFLSLVLATLGVIFLRRHYLDIINT